MSIIPTSWSTWSIGRLVYEVIKDSPTFVHWLITQGLIPEKKFCDEGHIMSREDNQGKLGIGCFRCSRRHMDGKERWISCTAETCFENCYLQPEIIVMIFLMFANDLPFNLAITELSFFGPVSPATILDWFSYCHEIISEYFFSHQGSGMLGGETTIVEVDFLRFGKRERVSHRIKEGMYVLGLINRGSKEFRLELCADKQDASALLPLIRKHTCRSTTVMCDSWSEFNIAGGYKYFNFRKVNYNGSLVKEPAWRILKRRLLSDGVSESELADHFMKFLFYRKVTLDQLESFEEFLKIIRLSYPFQ